MPDTSRADCDHEEIADHRARLGAVETELELVGKEQDDTRRRILRHEIIPHVTQEEVATLRMMLRAFSNRIHQLEEAFALHLARDHNASS